MIPDESWDDLHKVVMDVGNQLDLAEAWMNKEAAHFMFNALPGWKSRVIQVGKWDRLTVSVIGKTDFIAMKLMGARKRPQDREDIQYLALSSDEKMMIESHLEYLEQLNRDNFEFERKLLELL